MEPDEPDLSLLESSRWGIVPKLLVAFLCIFGAAMLYFSPPRAPRKLPPEPPPAPAAPAPQLYVTLAPPVDPEAPSATPVPKGWCCAAGGQLSAASREACAAAKGTFFAAEAEARKSCPKAPSGSPRGRGKGA